MLREVVELGFHLVSGPGLLVQDEVADFVEARYLHTGFVIFCVCVCVCVCVLVSGIHLVVLGKVYADGLGGEGEGLVNVGS